jgi:GTPase SAR1 family protein
MRPTLEDVSSVVSYAIADPADIVGRDYKYLVDSENRPNVRLERFYNGLLKVFGWVGGNPGNDLRRQASKLLYVTQARTGGDRILPNPIAVNTLIDDLTSSESTDIFLVGRRGSGKTAVVNYIINERFEEISSKNFTYFRADISKLHEKINTPRLNKNPKIARITVQEYCMLHAFMVVLQHSTSPVDISLHAFQKDSKNIFDVCTPFEIFINANSPAENSKLFIAWRQIRKHFFNRPIAKNDRETARDVAVFVGNCIDTIEVRTIYSLHQKLIEFFAADSDDVKTLLPNKKSTDVILIFDGVDNLRYDEVSPTATKVGNQPSRFWYNKYLDDLESMLRRTADSMGAKKHVYGLRIATKKDLDARNWTIGHTPSSISSFDVETPPIRATITKKLAAARNNSNNSLYSSGLSEAHKRMHFHNPTEGNEILDRFEEFVETYFKQHKERLSTIIKDSVTDDLVALVVFNENIRSLSRNLIRTFAQVDQYAQTTRQVGASSVYDRLESFRKAQALIFESSMLGGNECMPVNTENSGMGRWMPSLFEFDAGTDPKKWNGLIMHRVLNCLPGPESDDSAPTLEFLQDFFLRIGYQPSQITAAIYTLVDFGLATARKPGEYERTSKGAYVSTFIFKDAIWLYLCATGAAFGGVRGDQYVGSEIEHRRKQGYIHRHVSPRGFHVAVIRTGILCIRHLQSVNDYEINFAKASKVDLSKITNYDFKELITDLVTFFHKAVGSDEPIVSSAANKLFQELKDKHKENTKQRQIPSLESVISVAPSPLQI